MNRKNFIKGSALGLAGIALPGSGYFEKERISKKDFITVAHITDVHIRPGDNAPARFKECLKMIIRKHQPDFFLNTGDSIQDASYDDVVREQVVSQWQIWDNCLEVIKQYEMYSCIGNHDPWWKAPSKEDEMFGKEYVVKRLKMPGRYYGFSRQGWHFIVLDGNNANVSLDDEQFNWLQKELEQLPDHKPVLIMSHYPILGTTPVLVGGGHSDFKKLKDLFYKHRDKVKVCLSGHNHLSDTTLYNNVYYCCNGAMSGFWWGRGDQESAGPGYYLETPPGYAVLKLFTGGRVENQYIPHGF
ncbi:metallophosphoesterase [Niabella ginsenosidivorans]|uniref:Metallophosphoesterase n=1 Tax=Niabella ginsenosidivorans TaxID=1176587 RepID=A0A1A9I5S6_9BACT|nr:metallophosphoesterase [Niabella ginsenosidivorans]ANH83028.1 metallophosphoesterase [Niabella ginsenosidivorans]